MRKDILDVMDVFRSKGYVCGYMTTNGTIIIGGTRRSAGGPGPGRLPEAHQRVDRRARRACTTRPAASRARSSGHRRDFAGCRRPRGASTRRLRVSINTTVAHETLDALDQMVDVAGELGVDAIGLNHLMFSTPEEVDETVRLTGARDASLISTYVTPDPGLDARAGPDAGRRAGGEVPRSRHPVRHAAEGAAGHSRATTTRRARRSPAGACIRSSRRACRSAARRISVRSSASRSAI